MRCLTGCLFAFLFAACTDNTKIPGDIIPKQKWQEIMWDMVQADRFVNGFLPKPGDSTFNKTDVVKVYEGVFKVHGISREEFLKSYKFYLSRPDISKVIFDSISVQSERRKAEVYNKKHPKIDSLKKKINEK